MDETALDKATAGDDWAFWRAFADVDLFLLLTEEPQGADLSPQVYDVSEGRMVLAFDREDRLAGFSPLAVPYAALPGRVLAGLAAGQGLGLGLNLGSGAASELVLPAEALEWLVETLAVEVPETEDVPASFAAPQIGGAAEAAVVAAVGAASGLAEEALLAEVTWADGRRGHVLAFAGVAVGDQAAVARSVAEALALSGLEAAALDVMFPEAAAEVSARLRRVARRYVPQAPVAEVEAARVGPGMDKARPPRLK